MAKKKTVEGKGAVRRSLSRMLIALGLGILLFMGGCSSSDNASVSESGGANQAASTHGEKADMLAAGGDLPSGGDLPEASQISRKLIYNAHFTVEAKDYETGEKDIRELVHSFGGYILEFNENRTRESRSGIFTAKIPADDFHPFLEQLEQKFSLLERNIRGQDVTEEYVDLEARLKAKEIVEARLIDFMEKATKAEDLVQFSNELGKVQEEIERIKGRLRYIDQNVAFSTVEIRLFESGGYAARAPGDPPLLEKMGDSLKKSTFMLLRFFEMVLLALVSFVPILAFLMILAAVVLPLWRWIAKRRGTFRRRKDPMEEEETKP